MTPARRRVSSDRISPRRSTASTIGHAYAPANGFMRRVLRGRCRPASRGGRAGSRFRRGRISSAQRGFRSGTFQLGRDRQRVLRARTRTSRRSCRVLGMRAQQPDDGHLGQQIDIDRLHDEKRRGRAGRWPLRYSSMRAGRQPSTILRLDRGPLPAEMLRRGANRPCPAIRCRGETGPACAIRLAIASPSVALGAANSSSKACELQSASWIMIAVHRDRRRRREWSRPGADRAGSITRWSIDDGRLAVVDRAGGTAAA